LQPDIAGYFVAESDVHDLGEEAMEASTQETGQVTGTKDKDYDVLWFTEQCLSNALRLETYVQDAERDGDSELAEFFRRAQEASRKGAEQGKALLRERLAG
jgi:hypothetical protein